MREEVTLSQLAAAVVVWNADNFSVNCMHEHQERSLHNLAKMLSLVCAGALVRRAFTQTPRPWRVARRPVSIAARTLLQPPDPYSYPLR